MNTIVMNTVTGAVSEYTHHAFDSLTPEYGGSALGLHKLGGDTDDGAPIVSTVATGARSWGGPLLKRVPVAYLHLHQSYGEMVLRVGGTAGTYEYTAPVRSNGVSRIDIGRGVRETFLSFEIQNKDGQFFRLTEAEFGIEESKSRRVR